MRYQIVPLCEQVSRVAASIVFLIVVPVSADVNSCHNLDIMTDQKSETRMTDSVLKQDPNTCKVQKNAYLLGHKHTICIFSG